jgi:hypothetical protein
MKRKIVFALSCVSALALAAALLPTLGTPVQAQPGCLALRGVVHFVLPTPYPLAPTDTWGADIYASLGGEFMHGTLSGNDGITMGHGPILGQGRGGSYTICLQYPACTDSFTYEVPTSVFQFSPGKIGLGDYKGNTAKIVGGTGRFQGASGNLNLSGPFIVWPSDTSPIGVAGRGSIELSGSVCGVQ